ncbi:DUF192 domain-containing protein [Bacillus timonensis]|nr:DUF192 domain-containing protein [Bacillus timonensis]
MVRIVNQENGMVLAKHVIFAYSFHKRLLGLMFTKTFPPGSAIHIKPCRSIHTFFMNYSIDVLYLSEEMEVLAVDEDLKPGKIGQAYVNVKSVIELPVGSIKRTSTMIGHKVKIEN